MRAVGAVSRLRLGGLEILAVNVTPPFYNVTYISSYVIRAGGTAVVVDPGPLNPGCERLAALLEPEREIALYVTHVHIDHGGSAGCLAQRLGARVSRVYVHPRGAPHMADPGRLWAAARRFLGWIAEGYGQPKPVPPHLVSATSDGEAHHYEGYTVKVLHTPGHASHHQSIVVEAAGSRILFPGDSAGMIHPAVDAVAPTTPPPFRLDMYLESLRRQMSEEPSLVAYTHAGPGEPNLLERHLAQVKAWAGAAESLATAGDPPPPSRLLDAVAAVDEDTRRFLDFASATSPPLLEALKHSAMGFIDYFLRARRG